MHSRSAAVKNKKNQGRYKHASHCCCRGQKNFSQGGEFSNQYLLLYFEPHSKEEKGHQAVVDPVEQTLADGIRSY